MGSVPETREEWNARHGLPGDGDGIAIKNAAGDLGVYMKYSQFPAPLRLPPLTYQLESLMAKPTVVPSRRRWRRRKNG
jgi:hypothetical protein